MSGREFAPWSRVIRAGALAMVVSVLLAGCGRRGPLQPPPPDPSAAPAAVNAPAAPNPDGKAAPRDKRLAPGAAASPSTAPRTTLATQPGAVVADAPDDDDDEVETATSVSPSPTPTARKRTRAYVVPNQSFVLDPLL